MLLAGLGNENYVKFIKQQIRLLQEALAVKSRVVFKQAIDNDTWLDKVQTPTLESRMMDWAFSYNGWNREKDIRKNMTVPCYLEPSMELLADCAFLDPKGKPILLFLRDTLHLPKEKRFVTAEFYARSFKAAYGITPFVVIYDQDGAVMKMGAMSGGFQPAKHVLPKIHLAGQAASVNITEQRAWAMLLERVAELQAIQEPQQRFQQQMAWIKESAAETSKLLEDGDFIKEAFQEISSDNRLLEEEFWKRMNGEQRYQESRKSELGLIRAVVADKRITAGIL